MIQSALIFLLGFVAASFLALLVAPSLWRRAAYLTRKRIESAVPLTVNELQADKDRLRAEHAIALRKIEMKQDETAARLTASESKVGTLSQDLKSLQAEHENVQAALASAQRDLQARDLTIEQQTSENATIQLQLETLQADLEARSGELQTFKRMFSETEKRLALANEKVEQFGADYDTSRRELASMRDKRRGDQTRLRESNAKLREIEQYLTTERGKTEALEQRLEKAVRQTSQLEEKLSRRERDFARTQQQQSAVAVDISALEARAEDAERERVALDAELQELTLSYNVMERDMEALRAQLSQSEALEVKIGQLQAAGKKLKSERDAAIAALKAAPSIGGNSKTMPAASSQTELEGDAVLRDQVKQLAAEVAHMTAMLEGEDNQIDVIIANSANEETSKNSLAARIRALREQTPKAAE